MTLAFYHLLFAAVTALGGFVYEQFSHGVYSDFMVYAFLPPLVLSLLFPFGFLVAIGYAGAVATLWTCIIPPLLAWKVRAARREEGGEGFRAPGGLFMIVLVILFGVLTAAFHLLNMVELLPAYKG